ncbi:hypothetical protein GRI40_10545 [Altererythrobacter aerius]|uniref:Uncharacterized protein n=1 Tax=Tsuneonella aeria TaxID=1837929 RepID=A0A6I4THU9_9SPHN|nr:hypothetical protein [Tsuneonella aeria]MXO75655.1 hypothetical protein [Tsuneonella aeria]
MKDNDQPPLTITIGGWQLAVGLTIFAIGIAGDIMLPDILGLDLACSDTGTGRRARVARMIGCAMADGPKGWFYLAWFAAPIVVFGAWLRRRIRSARVQAIG